MNRLVEGYAPDSAAVKPANRFRRSSRVHRPRVGVHSIGSVSKKLHLAVKPARPRPPVVLLESRSAAIATQQRSVARIIPERNYSAYDGFGIPRGDD
jgi:hypothetical protein